MNRFDTIIDLDNAIARIELVKERLIDMACTHSLDRRINNLIEDLESLRIDILQADLPGETE